MSSPVIATPTRILRTQFQRIIRKAGLTPWPKPFHNLRASRETELAADYPLHVVCAWIGNNALVAQKHYLQVTEADWKRAAQNPAQSVAEMGGQPETPLPVENHNVTADNGLQLSAILDGGYEYARQDSNTAQKPKGFAASGEQQRTRQRILDTFGPELVRIIDAWADLPEATRRAILALVAGGNAYGASESTQSPAVGKGPA